MAHNELISQESGPRANGSGPAPEQGPNRREFCEQLKRDAERVNSKECVLMSSSSNNNNNPIKQATENNSSSRNSISFNNSIASSTPVKEMFNNRSVFITGASGFIGRVLLEKLLRSYQGIKNVYILMRTKKNQSPYDRLKEQLKVPIFNEIKSMKNGQELLNKIIVIPGDIAQENLGISSEDLDRLINDKSLSILFHSAATIKFDEPLKVSINLNLKATKTILEICKQLPNLIGLCHVSTAYVNSDIKDNSLIEEKIYPIKDDPNSLIELANILDENLLQSLKLKLVDERPNTYTYTKALAEHLILKEGRGLPISIVRPSIVVAALREPLPGWIDNLNGPTGLILAIGKGLLRTMWCKTENKADIVPVDIVVNSMIASVYYTAKLNDKLKPNESAAPLSVDKVAPNRDPQCKEQIHPLDQKDLPDHDSKEPPIFHVNSGSLNPITWAQLENLFFPIVRKYPSCQVLRYPYGSFKSNRYHDFITRLFVHYLPALVLDMIAGMMGKKRQLFSIYQKVHMATGALTHFCTQNYNYDTKNISKLVQALENPIDRAELYMDIEQIRWNSFWDSYILGARRYVLKESDESLPEARKSFRRAYWVEMGLRALMLILALSLVLPTLLTTIGQGGLLANVARKLTSGAPAMAAGAAKSALKV